MLERQYLIDAISVNDSWRLFKILAELVDGFETLSDVYPCVSIFGSSRVRPGEETYEKTVTIAKKLAENGYHIITGGGPGIMEAGNKGAREGGGNSIGLNIHLPMEQKPNLIFICLWSKNRILMLTYNWTLSIFLSER